MKTIGIFFIFYMTITRIIPNINYVSIGNLNFKSGRTMMQYHMCVMQWHIPPILLKIIDFLVVCQCHEVSAYLFI